MHSTVGLKDGQFEEMVTHFGELEDQVYYELSLRNITFLTLNSQHQSINAE